MGRQRVAIIGATGSIGTQTLQVLRDAPDRFELVAYAVGRESAAVQELAAANPGAQRFVGLSGVELSDAILGAAPDLVVGGTFVLNLLNSRGVEFRFRLFDVRNN